MRKKALRLVPLMMMLCLGHVMAHPVDMRTVREVAVKFVNANARTPLRGTEDLQLVTTYKTESEDAAFHVFNTPNGFVIVSADDCATPILGYSDEGRPFDPDNVPIQLQGYLQGFVEQIQYGIENHIEDETVVRQWRLVRNTGRLNDNRNGETVEPLITTQWDQWYPYNALCPDDCPTGCTATATAQIMNYWQYPSKGVGYHSYRSDAFGYQTVFFNENEYVWDSMTVDHPNHISKLMYHVGVAMDMDYYYSSSSAYLSSAQSGLQNYFDYAGSSFYVQRDDYSDVEWNDMLTYSLNANMPILYEGYGGQGHAWVVDGYDANGLFHMNFGWSGNHDGYYSLNSLNIGWYNFNYSQGAVLGIQPNYSPLTADFEMTQGDSVLKFNFYDFSKGAPLQHLWQFGDGRSDTIANPIHLFDSAGVYSITLIVGNGSYQDTLTRNIEISIPNFLPTTIELARIHPYCPPVVLDYDRDGLWDFFATGCYRQYLYHNEDSIFSYSVLDNSNQTIYALPNPAIVDFLHENKPSILSSEREGFYFYNSDGTLVQRLLPLSIINNEAYIIVGDYNGDGEDDILLGGLLYKNIGNMNFIKVSDEFYDAQLMSDYDGDGDLDFIGYWIYRNDGNDVFTCIPTFSSYTPSFRPSVINPWSSEFSQGDMADINMDGKPDLVSGRYIYLNEGDDMFTEHNMNSWSNFSSIIDFNCDGKPETIKGSTVFELGYNNYADSLSALITMSSQGVASIDYDNNNIPDVVELNYYFGSSQLYYNTCSIVNNPPAIPQNLWVDTLGNSVVLHWDTVSDDHSRYGSITYNIMVGTTPDGFDIKSPLSNIETGKRYAFNRGNAGCAPLWKLNELPNGTYYWRVQAIDNSLAASPFSETGTFVIAGNNLLPQMSTLEVASFMNRPTNLTVEAIKEKYYDQENDTLQGVRIVKLPTKGSLYLGGSNVQVNQYIPYFDIDSLWFITDVYKDDSVWIKVFDGYGFSADSTLIRFKVNMFEKAFELSGVSGDVAWGDYDNDGKADFASINGIYHNTGDGFELVAGSVPPAERILWADINNDGWLDCLYDGYVLTNTGSEGFTFDNALVNWSETGIAVGDVNNDNKVDYIITGSPDYYAGRSSRLFYNTGNILSNDSINNNIHGFRAGDIAIADFDNDGRQDILLNGIDDNNNHRSTLLYKNFMDGSLIPTSDIFYGVNKGSLCFGDYDQDGDIDLLMCGTQGTMDDLITLIYDNNGAGMLDEHVFPRGENPFQPVALGQAKWFDFDNDGDLDVILSGMNSGTHLYKNKGSADFEEILNTTFPDLSYTSTDIIDFDGDGYGDILLSGEDNEGNPKVVIYNNCNGTGISFGNNQIAVPSDLSVEIHAYDATLSWNGETDGTCSYNVYLRNNNGYVVSPMADTVSGFRKVVSLGNAGFSNHYTIKDLPCGTYYWSVQSINKSQQGGLFAPEHLLVISPVDADTLVVYDTACLYYGTGLHTYRRSGIFYERYEREGMNDSIVELHLTINHDCTPIVYVAQHSVSYKDGCSWNSAFSDLQQGIDIASAIGGDIWIAEGVYYGDGVSDCAFALDGDFDISLYGGFAGDESASFDLSQRDFFAHPTVLDGQNQQATISVLWWTNKLVDGCLIRNGLGANVNGLLKMNNCRIQGSPMGSSLTYVEISNSIIEGNTILNYGCSVRNSVIVGPNISMSPTWSSYTNCIFWNFNDVLIYDAITYSAIQGANVFGEGNISLAHNNDGISPDSLYARFVDPENGDFRLSCSSACINMGTPDISGLGLPEVDMRGKPRVMDGRIDMGAFEYDSTENIYYDISVFLVLEEGGTVSGDGQYLCGETCTLVAAASEGYTFVNWTENGEPVSESTMYEFTVTGSRSLVANFNPPSYEIAVVANPIEGGEIIGAGTYDYLSVCTLTATPNECCTFINWTENGELVSESATYVFTVTGPRSLVANFSLNSYEIAVVANPMEGGEIIGAGIYDCFSTCTLTATANEGYAFVNWTKDGEEVSSDASYSFNVTESGTYVANFGYEIVAFASPMEGGFVEGDGIYFLGATCTLTAWANEGSTFLNWTNEYGMEVSNSETFSFTVTGSETYYANFDMITYDIIVLANPEEGGWVSGEGSYNYFDYCVLIAEANEGYVFVNWTTEDGSLFSLDSWLDFNVTESATFVANFSLDALHFTAAGTWSESSNWQGNALPGADAEVFIDAPCQLDQNATVAALTVSEGQSITLQSGKTLTVTGDLTNTVTAGLVIEDGAQLVHNVDNVQATVKKFITPFSNSGNGWHLIAMPLTGSLEVESVDNLLEGEYDLYGYDESTAYWMNSKHPGDGITALEAAKGYLYASGEEVTLEFSGTLENGSATITVPLSYTDEADFSGFNLVGNPFPCNAYLDREYYVLNTDGTGINPVAVSSDTPIPPCTAVFVKAVSAVDTVVFTKVMQ